MLCEQRNLGTLPISESSPSGANPREGEAFAAALAEVDKLSSLHAENSTDWHKLSEICATILAEQGKDFSVATWLLCAWTQQRGLAGLADGIHVLLELIDHYWETMTPPVNRLRARRNQAEWLMEWLDKALGASFEPIETTVAERLQTEWDALDELWRAKDDQAPGFFRLRRRLRDIPVMENLGETSSLQKSASESQAEVDDLPSRTLDATTAASIRNQALSIPAGIAPAVGAPDSEAGFESHIEKGFESMAPALAWCLEHRPTSALLLRVNRQAAWVTLTQPPHSDGPTTLIPEPAELQRETLTRLQQDADPLDVVRFCESRIGTFPFWLDLNRVSHNTLTRAGASTAADAVALETRHLLARLPTLTDLTFAGGMPFADAATRQWLQALIPPAQTNAARHGERSALQATIDDANVSAAQGDLNGALDALQRAIHTASSERERFRLRTAQCALVHRFDAQAELYIPLEGLLLQAEASNLAQWEPALVTPLLEMILDHSDQPEWSKRLARLDLPGLWRSRHGRSARTP